MYIGSQILHFGKENQHDVTILTMKLKYQEKFSKSLTAATTLVLIDSLEQREGNK